MIECKCSFSSIILRTQVEVRVYLPNPVDFMHPVTDFRERYSFPPFKTVFLLHGMMDSARQWVENTSITRLAEERNLALVIPSCGNNFYVNTVYGAAYSDFIHDELTGFVRAMFPLSEKREDNYLWGISMGGYGALRQGFIDPDRFCRVVAMSPTADIEFAARFATAMGVNTEYLLGDWKTLQGSDLDLQILAEKAKATGKQVPEMLVMIADQDYMVRDVSAFQNCLEQLGLSGDFRIHPGDHTWSFWDRHVEECLDWLLKKD